MNHITHSLVGETLFVEFEIEGAHQAYLDKWTKRYRKATASWIEHLKAKEPDVPIGTLNTKGKVTIAIKIEDLLHLGWAASSNVNKTAKYGAARAKFQGTLNFEADFVPKMND